MIDLQVQIEGNDSNEHMLFDVQDWIKQEQIEGVNVQLRSSRKVEGHMGSEFELLSIILGSQVVVELLKSIYHWIEIRRPALKIKFKINSSEVEIDTKHLPNQQEFIEQILALVRETK